MRENLNNQSYTKLGIGITTFNRRAMLERTLTAIAETTTTPYVLFVADDGSLDGTREMLKSRNVPHLAGANRGIAWNKNRVLFYLHRLMKCDVIIVLEDDTFPIEKGWETPWVHAVKRYGHINLAPSHWAVDYAGGDGTPTNPFQSTLVTGQCVGFSSAALDQVGYMDPRFRRYGFEHAEHTERLIRCGFGGVTQGEHVERRIFLISSALKVEGLDKPPDFAGIALNAPIMQQLKNDPVFRSPWRDDEENAFFQAEMGAVYGSMAWEPGPDWILATYDSKAIRYDFASQILAAGSVTLADVSSVGVRVRGQTAWIFANNGHCSPQSWFRFVSEAFFEIVVSTEAATSFQLVYAPGPGFGLRTAGRYLCCEGAADRRLTCSRSELRDWETFRFGGYLPRLTKLEGLTLPRPHSE